MSLRPFEGKTALVTGAGNGIGRTVAKLLHERGAKVFALDRDQKSLDDLKSDLQDIEVFCIDLADWSSAHHGLELIPVVDLLVNNAGVVAYETLDSLQEETIDRMMDVNVKGTMHVTQVVTSKMKEDKRHGSIVNVASRAGFRGMPMLGAYAASKAAVIQLTRVMAIEYGPQQVRVNAVCPSIVDTSMLAPFVQTFGHERVLDIVDRTPLRRICQPEDVAEVILFLLSDAAAMVNGAIIPIDGGWSAS